MPIYEYVCQDCGKLNEVLQKVSDPPPEKCDGCGAHKLTKIVSRSTFVLKGSGWYSDLYSSAKKDGSSKSPSSSSESKKGPAASSGSAAGGSTPSSGGSAKVAASPAK